MRWHVWGRAHRRSEGGAGCLCRESPVRPSRTSTGFQRSRQCGRRYRLGVESWQLSTVAGGIDVAPGSPVDVRGASELVRAIPSAAVCLVRLCAQVHAMVRQLVLMGYCVIRKGWSDCAAALLLTATDRPQGWWIRWRPFRGTSKSGSGSRTTTTSPSRRPSAFSWRRWYTLGASRS